MINDPVEWVKHPRSEDYKTKAPDSVDPTLLGEFSDGEYDDLAFNKKIAPEAVLVILGDEVVQTVDTRSD